MSKVYLFSLDQVYDQTDYIKHNTHGSSVLTEWDNATLKWFLHCGLLFMALRDSLRVIFCSKARKFCLPAWLPSTWDHSVCVRQHSYDEQCCTFHQNQTAQKNLQATNKEQLEWTTLGAAQFLHYAISKAWILQPFKLEVGSMRMTRFGNVVACSSKDSSKAQKCKTKREMVHEDREKVTVK